MEWQERKPADSKIARPDSRENHPLPRRLDRPRVPPFDPYFAPSAQKEGSHREGREHIPFRIYD
jgi:hypothetical protein